MEGMRSISSGSGAMENPGVLSTIRVGDSLSFTISWGLTRGQGSPGSSELRGREQNSRQLYAQGPLEHGW